MPTEMQVVGMLEVGMEGSERFRAFFNSSGKIHGPPLDIR